jgi:aryl-alcohol dehydrogenase-like predicted oxidoreductase
VEQRQLGRAGVRVSELRLGTMTFGRECDEATTPAQVALNWVTNRPQVTSSLLGARTLDQLKDNLGAVGWRLNPEQVDRLDESSRVRIGYPQEFQQWMAAVGM